MVVSVLRRLLGPGSAAPASCGEAREHQPDYTLALEEARRSFDALSDELPALRTRTTQVLGLAGLAASFIGGLALRTDRGMNTWGWVAIAAFVVTAGLCAALLWPRRLYGPPDPAKLVEWAERSDTTMADMTRDLALHYSEKYDLNRDRLDRLSTIFCCVVIATCVEVVVFVVALWRT